MKKYVGVLMGIGLLCITGCASVGGNGSYAIGMWVSDVKLPGHTTANSAGAKVGTSECTSILGVVANGDASIDTAARNGGITKIKSVDYKVFSVLGIYAKLTTVVTGE
ncbi:MAG: hypothetical protein HZA78_04415 [Candidatus Schekmanbacteria bacterium]|nr:hypothetical protein [Candidatus Schekmanbacteria bacterium]